MNYTTKFSVRVYYWAGILLAVIFFASCNHKQPPGGIFIVTRVPEGAFHPGLAVLEPALPGASLIAIRPGKKEGENLTASFYSACSPHVSYDGKRILFAAQKEKSDPWQIWEMNPKKKTSRQITDSKESCYTPFYLPGNKLAFTKAVPDTGFGSFLTLFTMNLDGSHLRQITFHPARDIITAILKDGRILTASRRVFPDTGHIKFIALRPNGTKSELFYEGERGTLPGTVMHETNEGYLWFTEQSKTGKWDIIRIRYNRPLHSRCNCTGTVAGDFFGAYPAGPGRMIVCLSPPGDHGTGVYLFSMKDKKTTSKLLSGKGVYFLDPVEVKPYERPRDLPDELMCSYPTGLLMSQNVNIVSPERKNPTEQKARYIEVLGMDKSLGVIPVEQDGSFYLKIPANLPFRLRTLDSSRRVMRAPSAWMWLRPFERRGCVGCHEDPELSPENTVPMAINSFPVVIPVDTTQPAKKAETFKVSNMK